MTNTIALEALATAYANALNQFLEIYNNAESLRLIEDGLNELDPEWIKNIDPLLRLLIDENKKELTGMADSIPATFRPTVEYAARSKANGQVYDFGLFEDAEHVQQAIDLSGKPENFEVVQRGVTKWMIV